MMRGYRSFLFNAGITALSVLALVFAYLDAAHVETYLPPGWAWVTLAIGVINIVLRVFTTGPIFQGRRRK